MKVCIESTSKIVYLLVNGGIIETRIWEGETTSGIKMHCYIPRVSVHNDEDQTEFEAELLEQAAPSAAIMEIPMTLIL